MAEDEYSAGGGSAGGGGEPSGPAGGVLSGTYPDPGFAADMATQAELNAHEADTTSIHGITSTSQIAYKNAANTFTGAQVYGNTATFQENAIFENGISVVFGSFVLGTATSTGGLYGANAARPAAIANASTAHALNVVFSDTEVEAALDALGTKINAVLAALRTIGGIAT